MGQLAELSFTYQNLGLGGAFRSDDSANVGTNYARFCHCRRRLVHCTSLDKQTYPPNCKTSAKEPTDRPNFDPERVAITCVQTISKRDQ